MKTDIASFVSIPVLATAGAVLLVTLTLGSPAASASACLPANVGQVMTPATADAPFAVALVPRPAPIKVGAPFTVDLIVCSTNGTPVERVVVDATMPAHRHGMNYTPEIVAGADGRYEARNLVFHMPGVWQFAVSIYAAGKPTHLTLGVDVK